MPEVDISLVERRLPVVKKESGYFVTKVFSTESMSYVNVSSWDTFGEAMDDVDLLKKYHKAKIKQLKKG